MTNMNAVTGRAIAEATARAVTVPILPPRNPLHHHNRAKHLRPSRLCHAKPLMVAMGASAKIRGVAVIRTLRLKIAADAKTGHKTGVKTGKLIRSRPKTVVEIAIQTVQGAAIRPRRPPTPMVTITNRRAIVIVANMTQTVAITAMMVVTGAVIVAMTQTVVAKIAANGIAEMAVTGVGKAMGGKAMGAVVSKAAAIATKDVTTAIMTITVAAIGIMGRGVRTARTSIIAAVTTSITIPA
jgi:hypothetical protein